MAQEVISARERGANPVNSVRSSEIRKENPMQKIENFKNQYNVTVLGGRDGKIPMALSNYAFGLSMKKIKEDFPFLDNIGTEDQRNVMNYLIADSIKGGATQVANMLNASNIGAQWTVVSKNPIRLQSIDLWGNISIMTIRKKK